MAEVRARLLLLGDSICVSEAYSFGSSGYARGVAAALAPDGIEVEWSRTGTGSTRVFLEQLRGGAIRLDIDLIHFNAGLHDILIRDTTLGNAVPLAEYAANLREIVREFRARTAATLIWASTTPVIDELHQQVKPAARHEADVQRYNAAAATVMEELGVPVHDLHAVLAGADLRDLLGPDGCHPTTAGRDRLVEAVVARVRHHCPGDPT